MRSRLYSRRCSTSVPRDNRSIRCCCREPRRDRHTKGLQQRGHRCSWYLYSCRRSQYISLKWKMIDIKRKLGLTWRTADIIILGQTRGRGWTAANEAMSGRTAIRLAGWTCLICAQCPSTCVAQLLRETPGCLSKQN